MSRLSIVLILMLLMIACSGGGDDAGLATAAREPIDKSTTTTSSAASAATAATDSGVAEAEGSTTSTAPASSPTTAATSTVVAPAPVPPGTYRFKQTGHAEAAGQRYDSPPEGTLVVDNATAEGTQTSHRYVDPNSEPSDVFLLYGNDGITLYETILRQSGTEIDCVFEPGLKAPAWPPAVGAESKAHGDCDSFTTEVTMTITGRTPVTIDGEPYDAYVFTSTISTAGQVTSRTNQVDWFVAELRMSVHTENQTKGTFGAVEFSSTGTADLLSAIPA